MYKLITLIEVYDTFHTIAPSKFKYLLTKIFFFLHKGYRWVLMPTFDKRPNSGRSPTIKEMKGKRNMNGKSELLDPMG